MADPKRGGRIDVHHHFFAPDYIASMGDNAKRPEIRDWTLARTLEEMDKHEVATGMLSLSPPGIHHGTKDANKRLARAINEHAAKLRSERPARFGHFASVPMPDVDDTIAEIAYALDTLKADGVQLMTSYGDRWPGHPDFDPVFQELNRRKAVVFVHPLLPQCCANVLNWIPPALMEFTHDTNRCVFSLLLSGTLARCPDIRFIFCHAGAAVPILAGRAGAGLEHAQARAAADAVLLARQHEGAIAGAPGHLARRVVRLDGHRLSPGGAGSVAQRCRDRSRRDRPA